jgi:hypothetical protein
MKTVNDASRRTIAILPGCLIVIIPLFAVLYFAAHAPDIVVFGGFAVYFAIAVYTWASGRIEDLRRLRKYEGALARNEADVVHIRADEMVEIKEYEDLGACYAFQVEPDKIVFVSGQDFYASRRFPNTDFSLVTIQSQDGEILELLIDKHGDKLKPKCKIPASAWDLGLPNHLETLQGRLDDLEKLLEARAQRLMSRDS